MSAIFTNLTQTLRISSPRKPAPEKPADNAMAPSSDSDHSKKRKSDVYDVTEGGDDRSGALATPHSSKARKSLGSGSTAGSASKIRRRSRQSAIQNDIPPAVDPRVDAPSNLERALAPDAIRLQPELDNHSHDSVVATGTAPVAFMSAIEDPFAEPTNISKDEAKPAEVSEEATKSTPLKSQGPAPEPEPESAATNTEEEVIVPSADNDLEIAEVEAILDWKRIEDDSLDVLVHWKGEKASDATWEPEQEVQDGASELLYDFWKKKGGRTEIVFTKPKVTPIYHVFRIVNHDRGERGGFQVEVQWIGYPTTKNQTSWETETKIKKIAPDLLQLYWDSIGGREAHLRKRGRPKRNA